MTRTTASDTSHYAYRAAVYRLAMDSDDPRRNRRLLRSLRSSFAPPTTYAVTDGTVAIGTADIGMRPGRSVEQPMVARSRR